MAETRARIQIPIRFSGTIATLATASAVVFLFGITGFDQPAVPLPAPKGPWPSQAALQGLGDPQHIKPAQTYLNSANRSAALPFQPGANTISPLDASSPPISQIESAPVDNAGAAGKTPGAVPLAPEIGNTVETVTNDLGDTVEQTGGDTPLEPVTDVAGDGLEITGETASGLLDSAANLPL